MRVQEPSKGNLGMLGGFKLQVEVVVALGTRLVLLASGRLAAGASSADYDPGCPLHTF